MIASGILTSCSNPKISRDSNLASQPDKPKSEDQNESKSEDQNPKEVNVQPYKTNSNSNLPKPPIKTNEYAEKQNLPPPKSTHTQNFTIIERKGNTRVLPVKMLWLIDNSGSMMDDIPRVQAGIKSFVDALRRDYRVDITVTFVSCVGGVTCINRSAVFHPSIRLVDLKIESWDGLVTAALLLSKVDLFRKVGLQPGNVNQSNAAVFFSSFSLKGEPVLPTPSKSPIFTNTSGYSRHQSTLSHYFNNNDAINIIVSVTDDQTELSDVHFMNFLKLNYGSISLFRFYGFIGPGKDVNNHYKNLAHKLSGKTYNIISASQTAYGTFFKDLAKGIQSSTIINTFTLERNCTGIKRIVLDGRTLNASLYSCSGTTLNISKGAILGGKKITVTYYYS